MTIELNSLSFRWGNSIGKPSALGASLLAERHRWPLWLPVALGTGTALYFASPIEPAPIVAGAMALVCLAAGLGAYRRHDPWARAVLALVAALALGFANAKGREMRVAPPPALVGRLAGDGWDCACSVASRSDLLIASDGRTIALRGNDGRLYFPVPPKDHYAAQRWLLREGDSRSWGDAVNHNLSCDGLGCIAHQNGLTIALSARPEALDQDCARADLVISAVQIFSCEGPRLVLDAKEIASGGGYALRLAPLSAVSINQTRGARPWVPSQ